MPANFFLKHVLVSIFTHGMSVLYQLNACEPLPLIASTMFLKQRQVKFEFITWQDKAIFNET